jgi:hypothetical protein
MLVHALVYEQECSDVVGDVVWLARRALGSMRLGDAELLRMRLGRPRVEDRPQLLDALLIVRVRLVGAGEAAQDEPGRLGSPRALSQRLFGQASRHLS